MARCYQNCKHNWCNVVCRKYDEPILTSRNPFHRGLLIHPLQDLSMYYYKDVNGSISYLIKVAEKFLKDNTSKSIIEWYKKKGDISYKQRKYLVANLLNCFEGKDHGW